MSKERLQRRAGARSWPRVNGREAARAHDPLATLQAQANQSPSVAQLSGLQRGADEMVQREVDDTPLTHNGTYDAKGNLAHAPGHGVAGWAADDYRSGKGKTGAVDSTPLLNRDFTTPTAPRNATDPADGPRLWAVQEYLMAPVQVMVSMVDGKIGSIYFDGGRVRTTHGRGPTTEDQSDEQVFQYNIDRAAAFQEYNEVGARTRDAAQFPDENPERLLNRWIARRLRGQDRDDVPTWAYPIESLDDALEETNDVDDEGLKLFEVMIKPDGRAGYHPSRGAGVKSNLRITRAQMQQLKKAGQLFADQNNPRFANRLFYNYVTNKLPHLLPYLRDPEKIQYPPGK